MRRGCISLGDIQCTECHHTIPYPERYLIVEEVEGLIYLCVDCSLNKGYAAYKQDKGEQVLTFFVD